MARTAKRESEERAEVKTPDYLRAIKVMQNDIRPAEEKNQAAAGDLSGAWKIIEDQCHVQKAAAKVFRKQVLEASPEKRDDFLRSLYGLMRASNLGISRDLVDRMSDSGEGSNFPIEGESSGPDRGDGAEFDAAAPKAPAGNPPSEMGGGPRTRGRKPDLVTIEGGAGAVQ